MKVITKCVIDIASNKVIDEESYEYDGPVAYCGGSPSSGEDPHKGLLTLQNRASNIMRRLEEQPWGGGYAYQLPEFWPSRSEFQLDEIPAMTGMGLHEHITDPNIVPLPTIPDYNVAGVPTPQQWDVPTYDVPLEFATGVVYDIPDWQVAQYNLPPSYDPGQYRLTDYNVPPELSLGTYTPQGYQIPEWYQVPRYDVTDYALPGIESAMPTRSWWESLSPDVMAGLQAPYDEARKQLIENVQSKGMLGSQRGGYSGSAAAALGEFEAKKAEQLGLQAWQMTGPMMQQQWQAETDRRRRFAEAQTLADKGYTQAEIARRTGLTEAQLEQERWKAEAGLTADMQRYQEELSQRKAEWQADLQQRITNTQQTIERDRAAWQEAVDQGKTEYAAQLEKRIRDAEATLAKDQQRAQWTIDRDRWYSQEVIDYFDWLRDAQLQQRMETAGRQTEAAKSEELRRYEAQMWQAQQEMGLRQEKAAREWEADMLRNQLAQRGIIADYQFQVGRRDWLQQARMREYEAALQREMAPYMYGPSFLGTSAIPTPPSQPSPLAGAIGGGMTGALAGSMYEGYGQQYAPLIGGGLGALAGLFG